MSSTTTSDPGRPLRLLMPTVRPPLSSTLPSAPHSPQTRSPRAKHHSSGRLISAAAGAPAWVGDEAPVLSDGERWIGCKCRFEVIHERMELTGYQLYAVEKWIVERTRPVTMLVVYTGDSAHKIVVTVLSPAAGLMQSETEAEFNAAVQHLRKQTGARAKQTPHGTLMVTSLANFRSDYTIVYIPDGDFLAMQDRLYLNINLLRMGCSGRGAVTLDEPSDATKNRFKSMYMVFDGPAPPASSSTHRSLSHTRIHARTQSYPVALSPTSSSQAQHLHPTSNQSGAIGFSHPNSSQTTTLDSAEKSRHLHFASYVLELVKLVQAALAICGMFPLHPLHTPGPMFDGLLCDVSVDGLRKWGVETGEGLSGFEPTERIADPNLISLLLSFVLSARNKLATLAQAVPKDPFFHPHRFLSVLSSYAYPQSAGGSPNSANAGNGVGLSGIPSISPILSPLHSGASPQTIGGVMSYIFLSLPLYHALTGAHEKVWHSDSRRVHRVLLSRLEASPTSEGDATDEERQSFGGRVMGLVGRTNTGVGAGGVLVPTADLGGLIRVVLSGRDRERGREQERNGDKEKERDRESRDRENRKGRLVHKVSADEKEKAGSLRMLWSGKVEVLVRMRERAEERRWVRPTQSEHERERGARRYAGEGEKAGLSDVDDLARNVTEEEMVPGGAWSGRMREKLGMWAGINRQKRSTDGAALGRFPRRTSSVVIPLSTQSSSSGHVYPAVETKGFCVPSLAFPKAEEEELPSSGQASPISISRSHNPFMLVPSADVSSVSIGRVDDPNSGRSGIEHSEDPRGAASSKTVIGDLKKGAEHDIGRGHRGNSAKKARQRPVLRRRHSFHDLESVRHVRVLRREWMQIDVELCGQILVMRRRQPHIEGLTRLLEYLTTTLAETSSSLRVAQQTHRPLIESLTATAATQDVASFNTSTRFGTDAMPVTPAVAMSSTRGESPISLATILQGLPSLPRVEALQYEIAQLRVGEMWAGTRAVRAKVWELRARVFGDGADSTTPGAGGTLGGSRLRRRASRIKEGGRQGAVQWTLDGEGRVVDGRGRTVEEAREERCAGTDTDGEWEWTETESEGGDAGEEDEAGEGEEGRWVMPMWLLRVLTSWGARLGFLRGMDPIPANMKLT